jgi:hypothetical protein
LIGLPFVAEAMVVPPFILSCGLDDCPLFARFLFGR